MHSRARSVPLRARVVRASTVVPGDTAREDDARYHRGENGERVSPPRRHLPSSSASTDGCLERGPFYCAFSPCLLGEPNDDSPRNVAAAQLWASPEEYKAVLLKKYKEDVKL